MKIIATIEARMSSTRLPGKVLMEAAGKPMLYHLVHRLRSVPSLDEIVLATTIDSADDPLIEFANAEQLKYFRGSEADVLARVIDAAESVNADIIVGITGDCPIIDPQIVEQTIQMFLCHDADYVSNCNIRSYPDGMDTQVFHLDTLKRSAVMTEIALDHEHVTLHIRNNPQLFSQVHLVAPPELWWPDLGLTLDEQEDYVLLKNIIEHFDTSNPLLSCLDAVRLLREKEEWVSINRHIQRKGGT